MGRSSEKIAEYIGAKELALAFDRPIAYHKALADIGGGVLPGLLLNQMVYWAARQPDPEGAWWHTTEQFIAETGMTRSQFESARRELQKAGLIEWERRGIPARCYYRVIFREIARRLRELAETGGYPAPLPVHDEGAFSDDGEIVQTSLQESSKLDCRNPANCIAGFPQTIKETILENKLNSTVFGSETEPKTVHAFSGERDSGRSRDRAGENGTLGRDEQKAPPRRPPPAYPADIWPYAEIWERLFGRGPNNRQEKGLWIKAFRRYLEAGLTPEDMAAAYSDWEGRLTIKSPLSVLARADEIARQRRRDGRPRSGIIIG